MKQVFYNFWWNLKNGTYWYNLKYGVPNLVRFFKVIWRFRGWDYQGTEEILKLCLEDHLDMQKTDSMEVDETRLPRIAKLERALELLNHKMEEDYAERCGYIFYDIEFKDVKPGDWDPSDFGEGFVEPDDSKSGLQEIVFYETDKQREDNLIALREGDKLEKKEWEEFTDILREEWNGWWT